MLELAILERFFDVFAVDTSVRRRVVGMNVPTFVRVPLVFTGPTVRTFQFVLNQPGDRLVLVVSVPFEEL